MAATAPDVRELMRWLISAALVVLIHGGAALALVRWQDPIEPTDPAASLVVELAPMPVAAAPTTDDSAPGPQQVQAELAPEKPIEKVEDKTEPTRVAEAPVELPPALNPEVEVTPQKAAPPKEVAEDKPPLPPAPATTAPVVALAATAPVAAAPTIGAPNTSSQISVPRWQMRVAGMLQRHKRYPSKARARERGTAHVLFRIDRQGRLLEASITKSSGFPVLDEEAVSLLRRVQPFPPPPAEMTDAQLTLSVPIQFRLP